MNNIYRCTFSPNGVKLFGLDFFYINSAIQMQLNFVYACNFFILFFMMESFAQFSRILF